MESMMHIMNQLIIFSTRARYRNKEWNPRNVTIDLLAGNGHDESSIISVTCPSSHQNVDYADFIPWVLAGLGQMPEENWQLAAIQSIAFRMKENNNTWEKTYVRMRNNTGFDFFENDAPVVVDEQYEIHSLPDEYLSIRLEFALSSECTDRFNELMVVELSEPVKMFEKVKFIYRFNNRVLWTSDNHEPIEHSVANCVAQGLAKIVQRSTNEQFKEQVLQKLNIERVSNVRDVIETKILELMKKKKRRR